ncbi:MAG: LysM peptidoglycan-binding domain-containing protein [Planctomycetes bacterium]|nr:LysM peptidoglycan-binding domain-containing protein [Planctomycetota bacterium]
MKIAIFVASVLSLGLGLVWDQVLSSARNAIAEERPDVLGPERVEARVGAPDIPRALPKSAQPQAQPQPVKAPTPEVKTPAVEVKPAAGNDTEYTLVSGDNPWKLAHERFKDRKLETDDIKNANPNAKWRPGEKIKIPAKK